MTKKYICAVGDSHVFGDELITTYCADRFAGVSESEFSRLAYEVSTNRELSDKFYSLLDSMRFSSLVAKDLGIGHINYASGGASQESIKWQSHLMMNHLREKKIDPADTIWIVGLTSFSRMMFLADPHTGWHNMKSDAIGGDNNYVWSRYSRLSFFGDRLDQGNRFSDAFAKELIANTTDTDLHIKWAMNILDTTNLLIANGVTEFYLLSMFNGTQTDLSDVKSITTKEVLGKLLSLVNHTILPSRSSTFDYLFRETGKCENGHPTKEGHRAIADYLVEKIKGKQHEVV